EAADAQIRLRGRVLERRSGSHARGKGDQGRQVNRTLSAAAFVLATLLSASITGSQQPVFRAEARLVVLHPTVRNGRGDLVTQLDQGAFTVFENGKRQPITLFRRDDVPVSIGLLIDNSGSMRTLRPQIEAAALAFVRASHPLDEVFVVNFAAKARVDVPVTSDLQVRAQGLPD